jgi:predicted dehydrogenase
MKRQGNTRREFLKKAGLLSASISILPNHVVGGLGHKAPSDKMNIAGIGIGGKGHVNLQGMATENIIGLCDVDWKYADLCFKEFPAAKRYWDWRRMFDELGKSIDGVMVATADHTHAAIAATALTMGKHVYCQKPLTHSVYESRLLTKLAAKHKVATQMGNQGNSSDGVRQLCEWIWNNLYTLELERMVGFWHGSLRRYGLPRS